MIAKFVGLLAWISSFSALGWLALSAMFRWDLFWLEERVRQAQGKLFVWSSLPIQIEEAQLTATFFFLVGFLLFMVLAGRKKLDFWDGLCLMATTGLYFMGLIVWGYENWGWAFGLFGGLSSIVLSVLVGMTVVTLLLQLIRRQKAPEMV